MKKLNHTTYAILGLLTTDCRTGYQMKQMIDTSLNHFWKISYGQIYPTLKQLVEDGLANVKETTQDGKPDKKEYFLTEKGRKELLKWLEAPIDQIPIPKNEILLKLFFSRHQDNIKTVDYLQSYQAILEERLNTYVGIEQLIRTHSLHKAGAQYWLFTLDYGKRIATAEMEWCVDTMERLKKEE